MRDIVDFLVACWTTGTLLRSVCALVIVPALAWLAIRALTPAIARSGNDPGWQAPFAAAAAAIPGALLVLLAAIATVGGLHAACLETAVGRVLFGMILSVTVIAFGRALVLAGRRSGEATTLVRWSSPPSDRLAAVAARCGIATRFIGDHRPFCALAGTWRPTVIVSEGALARLSDAELEAALLHERGHARRGDQLIAAALSFLVDLLPLPAMDLVAIYRHAREVAADRHALATAQPHHLAGALLLFVQGGTVPSGSAALVGDNDARGRLDLLLKGRPQPRASLMRRLALTFALATVLGAGLAPASGAVLHPSPCTMHTSTLAR
ncbi:MAG: M56 family metallopeptidase [Candidatus Eremiobacteraeota bacterium]|nr:M56 family metallopeptidase [Candidatus Eremiobacteraeota bacterium]